MTRPRLLPALLILTGCAFLSFGEDDPGKATRQKLLHEKLLDHFNFGIDAPREWMNETRDKNGSHWDIKTFYFSGGAAKEHSWDTVFLDPWNKWVNPNKERGVWGENCIKDALQGGYLPWITFYNLAQSNPADYKPGPAQATPTNAKVKETMKAYFEMFTLLMKICAKHAPNPIVVQLEPDEWGHLLLSGKHEGKQLNPETVDIKVGSCGVADLTGLPDNLIGYAQGLKRLRDKYAPNNVLLACNPSGWDSQGSMSGKKFAEYLLKCGCGDWELATFETGDRDKGMAGKTPPYGDQIDICGKLDNHIHWIEEFHKTSGLYVFVWQVAMGNTYYSTCDNTPGHYCDNLAQLLLEDYPKNPNIGRYVQAGCAGFIFNGGQGDSTQAYDNRKDGISNPKPIPGNLGNKPEYADDDGGYLRLRTGGYYKQPYPILGKASPSVSTAATSDAGKPAAASTPPAIPVSVAAAKAKSYKLIDNAALESFKSTLQKRTIDRISSGSTPHIDLVQLHANARVMSCDTKGNMKLKFADDSEMDYSWSQLGSAELASLAVSVAQSESEDRAMAAFFCLWTNKPDSAKVYFEKSPECEQKVRAAFEER
jgi:hypothetical protein